MRRGGTNVWWDENSLNTTSVRQVRLKVRKHLQSHRHGYIICGVTHPTASVPALGELAGNLNKVLVFHPSSGLEPDFVLIRMKQELKSHMSSRLGPLGRTPSFAPRSCDAQRLDIELEA
jgi:hypothetical protein